MNKQEVLIVGGGIVGLTAALAMAKRNYTVALIDASTLKATVSKPDCRVYAINKATQSLLLELGVWACLDLESVAPYNKMQVWDGVSGAEIQFDSRYIRKQTLGTIVEESALKQALLQQILQEPAISLFPNRVIEEVHPLEKGVRILSQEGEWEGQLLMIADGAHSPIRKKLKVALTTWSYNQQALVARVHTEKPHLGTAYQVFHPEGPLAFLPLPHPHECSIVWSTHPEKVDKLMGLKEEEFQTELTLAFERLGSVELLSERHRFPLQMRHVQQYVGKNWLLLGDAAHTLHPLAGLGLNVGLADLSTWLRCLDAAKGLLSSKKALGAYQRERKAAVWQMILLLEGLKRLFAYSLPPVVSLRSWGLRIGNELPFLKRLFIHYAEGE